MTGLFKTYSALRNMNRGDMTQWKQLSLILGNEKVFHNAILYYHSLCETALHANTQQLTSQKRP